MSKGSISLKLLLGSEGLAMPDAFFPSTTIITRMTTFIKTKFKISDDQRNIDKYRLAATITEYHIISKLILQRIIITNFCGSESHSR